MALLEASGIGKNFGAFFLCSRIHKNVTCILSSNRVG